MQNATHSRSPLDTIRRTICVDGHAGETVLYETELAKQFGMSRTPIRQILQRLAYERLVFTKSGVGTVVAPLDPENRVRDFVTLQGLMGAVLLHEIPPLDASRHADVLALDGFARVLEPGDSDMLYELLARLHGCLGGLIPDPVLLDAFSAAFWRVTRWYMADLHAAPDAVRDTLCALTGDAAAYEGRAAADLFERVSRHITA